MSTCGIQSNSVINQSTNTTNDARFGPGVCQTKKNGNPVCTREKATRVTNGEPEMRKWTSSCPMQDEIGKRWVV